MKKPTIHVYRRLGELLPSLADFFVKVAIESINSHDKFTVALSGGSSPRKLYELLASTPYKTQIDWAKVYFFFGDERYVPATDHENNAFMTRNILFDPLHIPASNIFAVDTSLPPELAAKNYNEKLNEHFQGEPATFDLILLGLGENSHTASLFPYTAILKEKSPKAEAIFVDEINAFRISFTAPLINQARHIVFLVYGKNKAEAVRNILMGDQNSGKFPAQLIQTRHGEVHWFMEEDAASQLS